MHALRCLHQAWEGHVLPLERARPDAPQVSPRRPSSRAAPRPSLTSRVPSRDPLQNPTGETRLATSSELDAIRQSVTGIRQRLFHLETVLSQFVPSGQTGPDGGPMFAYNASTGTKEVTKTEADDRPSAFNEGGSAATGARGAHPAFSHGDGSHASSAYSSVPSIDRIREEGHLAESDGEVEGEHSVLVPAAAGR